MYMQINSLSKKQKKKKKEKDNNMYIVSDCVKIIRIAEANLVDGPNGIQCTQYDEYNYQA